ncbi:MAG: beta-N-acetylhexosaminidase [Ectothiorhodospira sp.]
MPLGPVMLDLEGTALTRRERCLLCHPQVGGVLLFTRNFESPEQLRGLIREIHDLRDPHLLVAVDHEGGRVQRFRQGFTHLPPMARLGALHDRDPVRARQVTRLLGWLMAAELRAVGVDFSFAPVLDLAHGVSGVIGDRAFHRRPEVVVDLGQQWVNGMRAAGMEAVGKHFPGHGGVRADSHLELPVDERPLETILHGDLQPFERLVANGIAGVMPAHVVYPQVDARPAGFSPHWLQQVLRRRLNFRGAVFSDDLSMAAAQPFGAYGHRARQALDAGCDMVLVCNHPDGAEQVVAALEGREDPVAMARLARMHGRVASGTGMLQADPQWHQAVAACRALGGDEGNNLEMPV